MKKKGQIIFFVLAIFIFFIVVYSIVHSNNKSNIESFFLKGKNSYELYNSYGKKLFNGTIDRYTAFENDTSLIVSKNIYYLISKDGKILKQFKKNDIVEKVDNLYVCNSKNGNKTIYSYKGKKIINKKDFNIKKMSKYSNIYVIIDEEYYTFYSDEGKKLLTLKNNSKKFITPNNVVNEDKNYLSFIYGGNTYIYDGNNFTKLKKEYKLVNLYKNNYILKDVKDEFRYYIYSNGKISGYFASESCSENGVKIDDNYVLCKDNYNLYKFDGNLFIDGLSTYVSPTRYSYVGLKNNNYVLKIKDGNNETEVSASDVMNINSEDRIIVVTEKQKYDIYNYSGKKLNNSSFKYLKEISNNNFIVSEKKTNYIINKNGNAISKKYENISIYNNSYLIGKNKNSFDIINSDGKIILSEVKKIYDFNNKFVYAKKGKKYVIYNLKLNKTVYKSSVKQEVSIDSNYYIIKDQFHSKIYFENGKVLKN